MKSVLDGLINTEEMITDIVPLEEVDKAFKLRNEHKGSVIHVMVDCD